MHTKVLGRGSTDRVLLLTEEASVICAETGAGGERGKLLYRLVFSLVLTFLKCLFPPPVQFTLLMSSKLSVGTKQSFEDPKLYDMLSVFMYYLSLSDC